MEGIPNNVHDADFFLRTCFRKVYQHAHPPWQGYRNAAFSPLANPNLYIADSPSQIASLLRGWQTRMPKPSVPQWRSSEATAKEEKSVTWGWTQLCSGLLPSSPRIGQGSAGCEDAGSSRRQAGRSLAPPWRCCQLLARPCAPRPRAPAPPSPGGPGVVTAAPQSSSSLSFFPLQSRTSQLCQLLQRQMLLLKWRLLASKELLGATYCVLLE